MLVGQFVGAELCLGPGILIPPHQEGEEEASSQTQGVMGEKTGFRGHHGVRMLYFLVAAMFIIMVLSLASDSEHTLLMALGFVGSFMLALVSFARDRWPGSDDFIDARE